MNPLAIVVLALQGCIAALTFAQKFINDARTKTILDNVIQGLSAVMVILSGHTVSPKIKGYVSLFEKFLETNKEFIIKEDDGEKSPTISDQQAKDAKEACEKMSQGQKKSEDGQGCEPGSEPAQGEQKSKAHPQGEDSGAQKSENKQAGQIAP